MSSSRGFAQPRDPIHVSCVSCIGRWVLYHYPRLITCLAAQSCPALCNPMDCSQPDLSIRGIFQARALEWVAISFSRGSSQPRDTLKSFNENLGNRLGNIIQLDSFKLNIYFLNPNRSFPGKEWLCYCTYCYKTRQPERVACTIHGK